jgi:hypothetical protein
MIVVIVIGVIVAGRGGRSLGAVIVGAVIVRFGRLRHLALPS